MHFVRRRCRDESLTIHVDNTQDSGAVKAVLRQLTKMLQETRVMSMAKRRRHRISRHSNQSSNHIWRRIKRILWDRQRLWQWWPGDIDGAMNTTTTCQRGWGSQRPGSSCQPNSEITANRQRTFWQSKQRDRRIVWNVDGWWTTHHMRTRCQSSWNKK